MQRVHRTLSKFILQIKFGKKEFFFACCNGETLLTVAFYYTCLILAVILKPPTIWKVFPLLSIKVTSEIVPLDGITGGKFSASIKTPLT